MQLSPLKTSCSKFVLCILLLWAVLWLLFWEQSGTTNFPTDENEMSTIGSGSCH